MVASITTINSGRTSNNSAASRDPGRRLRDLTSNGVLLHVVLGSRGGGNAQVHSQGPRQHQGDGDGQGQGETQGAFAWIAAGLAEAQLRLCSCKLAEPLPV